MFVSLFHSPDTALITAAHSTTPGAWVRSGTVDWPQVLCVEIDLTVLTVTRPARNTLKENTGSFVYRTLLFFSTSLIFGISFTLIIVSAFLAVCIFVSVLPVT